MIDVRQLHPGELKLYRSIRLAALSDAPYAFGSTYEGEIAFTESRWRERASNGAEGKGSICIIAVDGDPRFSRGTADAGRAGRRSDAE